MLAISEIMCVMIASGAEDRKDRFTGFAFLYIPHWQMPMWPVEKPVGKKQTAIFGGGQKMV